MILLIVWYPNKQTWVNNIKNAYFEIGYNEPSSIKLPKKYRSADGKLDSDISHSANQRKKVVIRCFQILIKVLARRMLAYLPCLEEKRHHHPRI